MIYAILPAITQTIYVPIQIIHIHNMYSLYLNSNYMYIVREIYIYVYEISTTYNV